jgi:hypothetical protein
MKTSKFAVSILKQADTGVSVMNICQQADISAAMHFKWKSKCGGENTKHCVPTTHWSDQTPSEVRQQSSRCSTCELRT